MKRFMRYQGNKNHFVKEFNKLVKNSKYDTYIEPFVGSGAILFNLDKEYNNYIINDLNKHLILIYKTFRQIEYKEYINKIRNIEKLFGDIKENKESYYNFRNWFNKEYFNTETIDEGIYLHILFNSCINSMARFGPNGFNQSFGNRYYIIPEKTFEYINKILSKTQINVGDYINVLKNGADIFLDPPYFERPTSYVNNFGNNDTLNFIENIKKLDSNILYTDIFSKEVKDILGWNHIITKKLRNTSPHSNKSFTKDECCYYNFKYKEHFILDDF